MMDNVELLTKEGDVVVTVKILPFNAPPEMIVWGQRIFVRRETGKYHEGFAVVAIDTVEKKAPEGPGERHTCPRRAEGPGINQTDGDLWSVQSWRFTDPKDAARWNQAEADKQNEEYRQQGSRSSTYANLRYWLWPGPGPKPRTCSYCGSVHPGDAVRLVTEFGFEVGATTKSYKLYLELPGYHAQSQRMLNRMRSGQDPVDAAAGESKIESIAPPLKLYSPHFSDEQWKLLWAKKSC